MRERLLEHIREASLFEHSGLALLAVSGGPDSVALLYLMHDLAPTLDLHLTVAHVDHGMVAESGAVARQVEELARDLQLPSVLKTLSLGPDVSETVAREARYAALRNIQRTLGARYLVTAHHGDDQVETVLYRFLRGSGMAGLAGIPVSGEAGLVRPLLQFTKSELVVWLADRWPVFADPSNYDERHDRAWMRHRLIPQLRDRFGDEVVDAIRQVGERAAEDREAWTHLLHALPELEMEKKSQMIVVARGPLARYHKTLSQAVLRAIVRAAGGSIGTSLARRLHDFVTTGKSGRVLQLGNGYEAELNFGRLRIIRPSGPGGGGERAQQIGWGIGPQGSANWEGWLFSWRRGATEDVVRSSFSTWVTLGGGSIRPVLPGDRIIPLGGEGHRKVRRLLMEAHIPARDRSAYPVVVRGSNILWIPGICRSAESIPRPGEPGVRLDAYAAESS